MEKNIQLELVHILEKELVPALGCTEPIAIAFTAAKVKEILGKMPQKIIARCSGNIIKNVKGVIVPTTGDMRGIETSAILGAVGGNANFNLQVLSSVKPEDIAETRRLLEEKICKVELVKGVENLYVEIEGIYDEDKVIVAVSQSHTNIVRMERNGKSLIATEHFDEDSLVEDSFEKTKLTVREIYEFANQVDIELIRPVLTRQIECNMKIAQEGMDNHYGAAVGQSLLKFYGDDIKVKAKAFAAAGSDARMAGCVLPVVINSGSGNQGMTVSIPVIVFAKHLEVSEEKLLRALALSNLLSIHQKSGIGKLSAYCGAVSAGCSAGAGIAYLHDEPIEVIEQTIKNALGNVAGIVCDGAKASCAAKIASSVDAAIMAYLMAKSGEGFKSGEGLITEDVESTIDSFARMAKNGMKETDVEILNLMIEK